MSTPLYYSVYTDAAGSPEHRRDIAHAIIDSDDPSAAIVAELRYISSLIDPDSHVPSDDREEERHYERRQLENQRAAYVVLQVIADRIQREGIKRPATPPPVRPLTRAIVDQHRAALRRLEAKAHRWQEQACNEDVSDRTDAKRDRYIRRSIVRIFGFMPEGFQINGDPRGYTLKTSPQHAGDLYKDWGGYGIIAPDATDN